MRPREVLLLTLRPLMVAGVIITGFATSAFCEDGDSGKAAYEASCAECHGQSGKGDGPAGAELRAKPPNLTSMAKRNGGIFPTEIVYRVIDGTRTRRAHGNYEMPVWGSVFGSEPEDVVRRRILAIIGYLQAIQVK